MTDAHASYAAAGVNIAEGDRAVELIAPLAKKATRPEVRGGRSGFRRRGNQTRRRPGHGQA